MTGNPAIIKAIEQLGYRVTVGDVAAQAGLEINLAQGGLLALASDAGGHLQVSDVGEIVYLFPKNFRTILNNKFWRLRLKAWWEKVWQVLFYLIRISFGIILILSILIMVVAIAIIIIVISSSRDSDSNSGGGGSRSSGDGFNIVFFPNFFDIFYVFDPGYNYNRYPSQRSKDSQGESQDKKMNFLEAIFSFLFGDGNPNFDLEERRWQEIGTVIRNQGGAVVAQQIAPYLDNVNLYNQENEDYILPVLARFNGYPEVSPQGEIIYYFPELQVMAKKRQIKPVAAYLRESLWRFSQAKSGQIMGAIGWGAFNFILALVLGALLQGNIAAELGGFVGIVASIYWILLGYAVGFLGIPLLRYFWIKLKNKKIEARNLQRQNQAEFLLTPQPDLRQKIDYARQFASEKVITEADITYSTEQNLLEQEIQHSDKIDEEWRRRLESGS
jgi:flagellar basal body-associated protein FliL